MEGKGEEKEKGKGQEDKKRKRLLERRINVHRSAVHHSHLPFPLHESNCC